MKTEQELYEFLLENWFAKEKEILEQLSKLAENNKSVHEKPLNKGLLDFNDTQRATWKSINLLDQLFIESLKEKALLVECLMFLLSTWHENYDQPAMKSASDRFFENDIANMVKSFHAGSLIAGAINDYSG